MIPIVEIKTNMDTKDYILMHKESLRLILSDNNRFEWAAKAMELLGSFFFGMGLTSLFVETMPYLIFTNGWILMIFGVCLTTSGSYIQKEKENAIQQFFKDKINEGKD